MRIILLTGLLPLAGCSLIYDGDQFRVSDAGPPDAPMPDAAPPADVDPSMLEVTGVMPDSLMEGEGSAPTGRAVPILVAGMSIAPDAVISVELVDSGDPDAGVPDAGAMSDAGMGDAGVPEPLVTVGETEVSADGMMAATTVMIPVMEDLDAGEFLDLRVVVTQAGGVSDSTDLTVEGLDELTGLSGDVDTDSMAFGTYSRVVLDQAVHFVGDAPARITATSEILVSEVVDADGRTNGTPGAGGCAGGPQQGDGDCGDGGGKLGSSGLLNSGPGGGGGGFGGEGDTGQGGNAQNPPGDGGMATGSETLVPLMTAAGQAGNRGNGGGGGGKGTLNGAAGGGGGGGGVIELRTTGTITFSGSAMVRADGGNGANSTGLGGGGGGGGSGGALLLHAAGGLTNETAGAVVQADGGMGGNQGSGNVGGDGAVGRVRIDAPMLPSPLVSTPTPAQGPIWQADLPTVVRDADLDATLVGAPGQTYAVWVGDDDQGTATIGGGGTRVVTLTLQAGVNEVCAFVGQTADFRPEASMCRMVVYLP